MPLRTSEALIPAVGHPTAVGRPRIAIVTVCLNDLRGLQATFESVRAQVLPPHQWIVADGNSSDGTREWLQTIRWPPLSWTSEADGGIYQGMNRGLRQVGAEYVLFLNSGDVLSAPDALEAVIDSLAAADPRPSLLYGDCFEVDSRGVGHLRRARPPWWVWLGMPTTHQAMYFRTDALMGGFETHYRLSGDYAAVTKLYVANRGTDFRHLPKPLCRFHLGGRSDQQRRVLLRENLEVRRRILGMRAVPALALHAAHYAQGWIKRHVPVVHRLMRYG
jgi:putative colanic acid biosynthesis glycosyltransferase